MLVSHAGLSFPSQKIRAGALSSIAGPALSRGLFIDQGSTAIEGE
jgi:hypothetical protein